MSEMTAEQRQALVGGIKRSIQPHFDLLTIEAYCKHYFWRWFEDQKKSGKPISIEQFWDRIPEECRVTEKQRFELFTKEHAELLRQLDLIDQVKSLDAIPTATPTKKKKRK